MFLSWYHSPLGPLLLAEREGKLAGLWIEGQKYFPGSLPEEAPENPNSPVLRQAAEWLDRYFAGEQPDAGRLPLAPAGTGFRQEVWQLLCQIPYGETVTYGALSQKLTARRELGQVSARAVGGAVGHNPISIIIPCHRVLGSGGSLTGYAGGLDRKIWLLAHEGVNPERFSIPK